MKLFSAAKSRYQEVRKFAFATGLAVGILSPSLCAQSSNSASPSSISASTATGIALSATAVYKVGNDNQWQDYESVVTIAALNEVAKMSANKGAPMTTADYVSIAGNFKTWLDGKQPQDPRFFALDKAAKLHYALDSLVQFTGSAPSGSLLPSALAAVERAKFYQLERVLDPNRQTPSDFAVYSVAGNADQFMADCIQEAAELANNDPQYAGAVNPLLGKLIGFDTSNSYTDIQTGYPNALPTVPAPNADGSFTLNSQDLLNQYQAVITDVQNIIDGDLATLGTPRSARRHRRSATHASQPGSVTGPCSTASQPPPCWDDAQSVVTGLSRLVGFSDSQLGSQISTVGSSVVKVGKAIDTLAQVGFGFGMISPVGTIIGAAVDIFGLFGGGSSANSAVLQQIQKLSQQITLLQKDMDNRFNQVDAKLNAILATLNTNFVQINYTLGVLAGDAHAIQAGLLDVQTQLNQMEQYLLAWTTALSREQLIQTMNGCLGYQARTGLDIGFTQYATCENAFYTWAHDTALDELWAGILQPDYSDGGIYPILLDFPFSVDVNYLAQFPYQNLQLPALSNSRIPNPNECVLGARAYLELAHEWPQYAVQISSSRIDDLIQVCTAYSQAVQNANSISNAGGILANQALFTALGNKYGASEASLQNVIQGNGGIVAQFTGNPSLKLGSLDLWGGPGQQNSFVPAAFNSASIPDCNGGSAWAMPPNLVSQVSPLVRSAEQLGLGTVSLCLSFSWYWAGTSLSGDPYGNGPADFALGAYQVQGRQAGALVFAQTIYGYSITDPAHQVLMCMGQPPLRTGNSEIWSQAVCADEYNISFYYYSITTNPVGSACQTLSSATSGGSPLIWNLSPQFSQFVSQYGGLYVCVPGAPLVNLFNGNSIQTDTSAGLNSLSTSISNTFSTDQQMLCGDIAGALCDPTTGCSSSGPFAGQLVSACNSLTGTKMLLQANTNFGLPSFAQTDDALHSLLWGNQSIFDCSALVTDFFSFSTNPVTDPTDNKITDEMSATSTRVSALNSAITADLNQIQQNGKPDSWDNIDNAIANLQSFEVLKNNLGISPCAFELSPTFAVVGIEGGGGAFSVQVVAGCTWTASTNASWITISTQTSGTGQGTLTFIVAPTTAGSARSGIIIVGDQIFRVYQAAVTEVQSGNFTASILPPVATIAVGSSGNFTALLTSSGGFSDQFAFSCLNPPPEITCSFNPVAGTLPANGSLSSTLTVTVNSKPSAVSSKATLTTQSLPLSTHIAVLPLIAFFLLCGTSLTRRKEKPHRVLTVLAALSLFAIVSCGGRTSTIQGTQPPPPPPTVTVTVQVSSSTVTKAVGTLQITVP